MDGVCVHVYVAKKEDIKKSEKTLSLWNASDVNGSRGGHSEVAGVHPDSLLFGHWATVALHSSWLSMSLLGYGGMVVAWKVEDL